MQIVHFICDRCYRHEIEDDSLDWTQTNDGRDLCPSCQFPFPKIPEPSFDVLARIRVGADVEIGSHDA